MRLSDFDFALPPELIAQEPAPQRDRSRLLVVERATRRFTHDVFANLGAYLRPGDVLVVNDTRVIPARLRGRKADTGGRVELLLLHDHGDGVWEALLRPAARVRAGTVLLFGEGVLRAEVCARQAAGPVRVRFSPPDIYPLLERCGEVPLPPYIRRPAGSTPHDRERYQTVYAAQPGAVAAPTAGLHFTPELLARLAQQGVRRATLTLHVGWGTFQPVRSEEVEAHRMEAEFYRLGEDAAATIEEARAAGGRVVAVGTTTTRALETIGQQSGRVVASSGWTELFIYPGYRFRVVDALITNFHLPRSTLFLLVCAFADRELMLEAYQEAIAARYRFYSYGDAMLIL
ncbi:MAG: S-adenosylmethionine:tRNA ribosyltransferase-isomerase [Candidatus Tectimicrobiota bacterium]|nr:MAG: S-adenosylmethionine:tRNA ribosyltransferase-isomerase [Candidatus Tectomicrobia bacterium]